MIIFGKTATKPNHLFGQLPNYFKENDSYVPNAVSGYEDQGFLERYLQGFCEEIDDEISPYLDNILWLFDALGLSNLPNTDPDLFLIHLSDSLGNPPDIGDDAGNHEQYKTLLRYLRIILQNKGSITGVNLYLKLFGYTISSLTVTPYDSPIYDRTPTPFKYDSGIIYDANNIIFSDLDMVISNYPGLTPGAPDSGWLDTLKNAIQVFLLPINTSLNSITYV